MHGEGGLALRRILSALVEPHSALTDVADRQRARLLAGLLAALVILGTSSGFVQLAFVPGFAPTFLAMAVALALLAVAYAAARSRHYRIGGWIASLAPIAGCAWVVSENPDDRVWYAFMLLGVLLASIFLSTRAAALVAALAVAAIGGLVAAVPELRAAERYIPALMLHAVMSPLLLLAAHHRNRLEAERTRARAAMEERRRESRRLEAVGRLAGGIAHDFNNLLTVLFANVSLIRRGSARRLEDSLDEIERVSERAADLTRQLLAFARRQVLEPRVVDLNAVIDDAERILQRLLREDIELRIERAPGVAAVRADPAQLEQVLVNLVLNGRDAMPDGGTLTVSLAEAELDGRPHVVARVSDTGRGMDPETKERIFEPFFTTKEDPSGTGLGLASVEGIVSQSGGRVVVHSEPGKGSTFEVFLPRVEEAPRVADPRRSEPERAGAGRTILLVEDEDALRRVTERILTGAGYRVLTACNGEEAIEVGAEHLDRIDLVVSDVRMPGMGGPEAARRLLRERPSLPVLFISGYADDAGLHEGELSDAAFLPKPFTPAVLAERVATLLGVDPPSQRHPSGGARSAGTARP